MTGTNKDEEKKKKMLFFVSTCCSFVALLTLFYMKPFSFPSLVAQSKHIRFQSYCFCR